jgi:hypothetical protein
MLRSILILTLAASLATGCLDRREPYRPPRRDRRDHRRHRMTGEELKAAVKEEDAKDAADNTEGGTPMPDVTEDKPQAKDDETGKEMLTVLKGISDKLDKQPQAIHHEFEQFAKAMDAGPPAKAPTADEPLVPVPQRAKSEAVPEQPSKFQPLPTEDGSADRPYGDYTGVRVHMDLTGTHRVNGRLVGGRCIPCREAWNLIAEGTQNGWTMGNGPQYKFWIVPATLQPGSIDPFWEKVENGRVVDTKRGTGWFQGDTDLIFRWHPGAAKRERRLPRGMDPDFPPKAPPAEGSTSDWPDDRPPERRQQRTDLVGLGRQSYGAPVADPQTQDEIGYWHDWQQRNTPTMLAASTQDPDSGTPLPLMGRTLKINQLGYMGIDNRWHNWSERIPVATYTTSLSADRAAYGADYSGILFGANCSAPASYAWSSCAAPAYSYAQSNCSQPAFAAANCSQPSNYGYQPAWQQQAYQPQQFYSSGPRMICGPNGCSWQY